MDIINNQIAGKINLSSIRAVTFYDRKYGNTLHFMQCEEESSWKLTPITRQNDSGGLRTIAYQCDINIYVPHNLWHDGTNNYIATLEMFRNQRVRTVIAQGTASTWSHSPTLTDEEKALVRNRVLNATTGLVVDFGYNLTFNYEIEQIKYRPRMIIRPSGIIKDLTSIQYPGENLPEDNDLLFK